MKAILVDFPGFEALHPRLDRVEWHGRVDSNNTCHRTQREGCQRTQFLSGSDITFSELFETRVCAKSDGAVRGLARRRRHETLEESSESLLTGNDRRAVDEPTHPGIRALPVIDELRLY